MAGGARRGKVRLGQARSVETRLGRYGTVWCGLAGMVWFGQARLGEARRVMAGAARRVWVSSVKARYGVAGLEIQKSKGVIFLWSTNGKI